MITTQKLVSFSKNLLRNVQRDIRRLISDSPQIAFSRIPDPDKDPSNQPVRVDYYAEDFCRVAIQRRFRRRIIAIGEESLEKEPNLHDLSNHRTVVALMDIIDGTDLLLRGLSNWCSAIVFFYLPAAQILVSAVCDHSGNLFFATNQNSCAFLLPRNRQNIHDALRLESSSRPLNLEEACIRFVKCEHSGPRKAVSLSDASVCFYGQKPSSFLSAYTPGFCGMMKTLSERLTKGERPAPALRIYDLGGIPIMVKVANGTVDAVFSLIRPKPHDMVAGAYIAVKAGAFLGDTLGNPIKEEHLAGLLKRPNETVPTYILAATKELYDELRTSLSVK